MAPASKKAKLGGKPTPGGGLNKFFGGAKSENSATTGASTPASDASMARSPPKIEAPAAAAPPPQSTAPSSGGLTEVQKQRIEENRRKALERQQAKKDGVVPPKADPCPSPSPLKPVDTNQLKRKGAEITPEKVSRASTTSPTIQAGEGGKFSTFAKVPWVQYNNYYAARLEKLRGAVLTQARSQWSNEVAANNFQATIATKSSDSSSDIVIIGITFKEMPSRDRVIEQYRDPSVATSCLPEDDVDKQPNLCSDADTAWLEDATFRIQLVLPAEEIAKLATGFVAAVRGQLTSDGKFATKEICFAQGLASTPLPTKPAESAVQGSYLALLSGLSIGAPDEDVDARNRAVDFLMGRGQAESEQKLAQAVNHVIVCGGVYHVDKVQDVPAGLDDADKLFAELAQKLPVEVMPGHKDPSNLSLPQFPLHPYLFRTAKECNQFKSVSNPYSCKLGDLQILGHSGQPVRDLMRCTSIPTELQALTTCLDGSLLAPTAPDTLVTQAFTGDDPFVIETMPQLLFSGGHSKLAYEWRAPSGDGAGTLCVCIPAFHKHPAVVLVNTHDPRDIRVQEFGTNKA